MVYELPKLSYAYDALEPYIDAKTMEIHYGKHHKTYCDKLNAALEKFPELSKKKAEEFLRDLSKVPEDIRMAVRNNGGGFVNHNMFWEIMTPDLKKREFRGKIAEAIKNEFGGFEEFKKKFSEVALNRFGSGWVWLVMDKKKKLSIMSTANQDNPMSEGAYPILALDVWEHAYYLKYQNRRAEYVENWFNVINWNKVNELYVNAIK